MIELLNAMAALLIELRDDWVRAGSEAERNINSLLQSYERTPEVRAEKLRVKLDKVTLAIHTASIELATLLDQTDAIPADAHANAIKFRNAVDSALAMYQHGAKP